MQMLKMAIWIDADSCPALLRDFIIKIAKQKSIIVSLVANREILQEADNIKMIICDKEKDAADNYILQHAQKNDIIITRDILFAAKLVEKNITVLNDRGFSFNKDNIQERLMERNLSLNLSEIGFGGNKKNQYSQNELKKFTRTFEYELQKHITAEVYSIS